MKQRLLSALLALCMALTLLPGTVQAANTSGSCGEGVTWSYSSGTLTIQGAGSMDDYGSYTDQTYIGIVPRPWSDYKEQIHTINIGDGVISIGSGAFYECSSLLRVTIPDSVISIGEAAFADCSSLLSVTIPQNVISIGWNAFRDCSSLLSVTIPDSVISIGTEAFSGCVSLTGVIIPGSVATIGRLAFSGCSSLSSMTIPGSVTSIGARAFVRCSSLRAINVASENSAYSSVDGVLFSAGQTLLHTYPAGKNDRSYSIPASVTSIGECAFYECSGLVSVTIPDSVTSIGEFAFWGNSLTSLTLPGSITSVARAAFNNCANLTSLTIPASVTTIEEYAFGACSNLTDVYYGGSESQWELVTVEGHNTELLNATVHCNGGYSGTPTPSTPAPTVVLSPQKLMVNGKEIGCEKYNIDGANYFKLRDLAYMLNGTSSQFDVGFDAATSTVTITTGSAYTTPNGGELQVGADNSGTAQVSAQTIMINGVTRNDLTVYNIGGSNFFQLRELGTALGFEVGYDQASNAATVTSK